MKKLISTPRLVGGAVVLALLVMFYIGVLYKLQIVEGAAYNAASANSNVIYETVAASRGNIMDRYGRLLVSSRTCYNIAINSDELFEQENPNAVILKLIETVESFGESYTDDLPITKQSPFEFTEMSDVQRTILNGYLENAVSQYTGTALATGLAKENPNKGQEGESDYVVADEVTAVELMAFFRSAYKIDHSYDNEQTRKIAGLRYEINSRYIVPTADYIFVENASMALITSLLEQDIPGIEIENSYVRQYNTTGAAHILGYIGSMSPGEYDNKYGLMDYSLDAKVGKDGAERAFETYLHGTDGEAAVTKTADGSVVKKVYTEEPQPGDNVYLTIDIVFQEAVERVLSSNIEKMQAQRDLDNAAYEQRGELDMIKEDISGGAIVAVDVKTGEPLAIASYPDYDLTTLLDHYTEISQDERNPLFNRALQGTYAPGSTFKPCTAIAALTEGKISTETTIVDEGVFTKYEYAGYAPACWIWNSRHTTHGALNVSQALMVSCNYFFYQLGDYLGIDTLSDYALRFGLGTSTGIELYEETGVMSTQEYKEQYIGSNWYAGDTIQAAIGQSYNQFTPLQLAEYCAAIANGGNRHTASILKKVSSYDYSDTLYQRDAEVLSTVESDPKNYKAVQYGMYLVANAAEGSAYATFYNYPVTVAAKTGSAQRGEGTTDNAVFMCYAPYDDPGIAVAVVVEKGAAGSAIAQLAREVLDAYFSIKDSNETVESEMTLLQ